MDEYGKDMTAETNDETESFDLDDILREFGDSEGDPLPDAPEGETESDELFNTGNLELDGETRRFDYVAQDSAESLPGEAPAEEIEFEDAGEIMAAEVSTDDPEADPEAETETQAEEEAPEYNLGGIDYEIVREYKPVGGDLDELLKDVRLDLLSDEQAAPAEYAAADSAEEAPEEGAQGVAEPEDFSEEEAPERTFAARTASPFVALMAMISMRRQQRAASVKAAPPEEAEDLGAEMSAERASRYYGSHVANLRLRTRLSFFLCIILMYISFELPVFGQLNNPVVAALVCVAAELAVVVLCLDVFTAGLMDLFRKKPGAGTLVAISCILSAGDGIFVAATGGEVGLPFCAVSALSICCALWGSLLRCKGTRITLRTLAISKSPTVVTAESGIIDNDVTLLKSKTSTENFVRRTEEAGPDETAYNTLAPWIMTAAVVLALAAAFVAKDFKNFLHILTAIFLPAAPLSALLALPLPFSGTARRIFHSGSAIAGWSGLYDIGGSKHIIITDSDIFPRDTVSIESIRILEGMNPQKVISYAGSVITASGSGLAHLFTELMTKNRCSLEHVEDFRCHEGGGLTAMINGEEVLCGNSGFMHLMGIRLPQKLASKTSVFVAINSMICAIFTINYVPVVTVQRALASLLRSRRQPIFAIRDFNITPEMIRHKFRMPTDGFDFPSFAKRYEISSAHRSADSGVAAIVSREGLGALVELYEEGHRLYSAVRLSVMLSVLCTILGMILMFFLCLTGAYDSVSVSNLLLYMLIWLLPELVVVYGLRR